jgi:hypothetical protein
MGYNPPYLGPSFGETDWWYWGVGGHDGTGPGKCGEYEGQSVGIDASVALTNKAMISIPLPSGSSGRVYFTDDVTIFIHPDDYPVDWQIHPYGRHSLLFWEYGMPHQPQPDWVCLCPDEMNYYLNNLIHIICPDNQPEDMVVTKFRVESALLSYLYAEDFSWVHFAFITYAIPNTTPLPPEL